MKFLIAGGGIGETIIANNLTRCPLRVLCDQVTLGYEWPRLHPSVRQRRNS